MNRLVQYSESFVIRKRKKAPSKLLAKKPGSYQVWRGVPINKKIEILKFFILLVCLEKVSRVVRNAT